MKAKPTKLYKRPTTEGVWHPVQKGRVMLPVWVDIYVYTDPDTEKRTRTISIGTFNTEESRSLKDYPNAQWIRYRAPKVVR